MGYEIVERMKLWLFRAVAVVTLIVAGAAFDDSCFPERDVGHRSSQTAGGVVTVRIGDTGWEYVIDHSRKICWVSFIRDKKASAASVSDARCKALISAMGEKP